jgi:hypothetical protein
MSSYLGRKRIRLIKPGSMMLYDPGTVNVMRVQTKPLGDTTPNVLLSKEKVEQTPFFQANRGGGDIRVRSMLTPLDMVEPSNLGRSERIVNREVFLPKMGTKTLALIPPEKRIDEMSTRDLIGHMVGRVYSGTSNLLSSGYNYLANK